MREVWSDRRQHKSVVERDHTAEDPIIPSWWSIQNLHFINNADTLTAKKLKKFRIEVLVGTLVLPLAPTLLFSRVSHNMLSWGKDWHFFCRETETYLNHYCLKTLTVFMCTHNTFLLICPLLLHKRTNQYQYGLRWYTWAQCRVKNMLLVLGNAACLW